MTSFVYVSIVNQSLSNMYFTCLDMKGFLFQPLTCMISYLYSEKMDRAKSLVPLALRRQGSGHSTREPSVKRA